MPELDCHHRRVYGAIRALKACRSPCRPARWSRCWAQRRRQDHHVELHFGRRAARRRAHRSRARRHRPARSTSSSRAGIVQVPEGREIFPELSVADNLLLGPWLHRRKPASDATGPVYDYFPRLKERASSAPARCRAASSRC